MEMHGIIRWDFTQRVNVCQWANIQSLIQYYKEIWVKEHFVMVIFVLLGFLISIEVFFASASWELSNIDDVFGPHTLTHTPTLVPCAPHLVVRRSTNSGYHPNVVNQGCAPINYAWKLSRALAKSRLLRWNLSNISFLTWMILKLIYVWIDNPQHIYKT